MSRFIFVETSLHGLRLIERRHQVDERGFFSRFFCARELSEAGFDRPVAQINHTATKRRGTVRGLHFQFPPHAEIKIVSCLRGAIFDVAVDLRRNSPTFLHWHAEELSEHNARSLLIPVGFAHGFQALTDDVELIYLHSEPYAAEFEGALNVRDPRLAITWPLPFTQLSARDAGHLMIGNEYLGLDV